jgi:hypothetical protein
MAELAARRRAVTERIAAVRTLRRARPAQR